jgi:hypothetical protein
VLLFAFVCLWIAAAAVAASAQPAQAESQQEQQSAATAANPPLATVRMARTNRDRWTYNVTLPGMDCAAEPRQDGHLRSHAQLPADAVTFDIDAIGAERRASPARARREDRPR